MSAGSSKVSHAKALIRRRGGWGPIEAVILGYLSFKVPEWLLSELVPFILPLLPFSDNIQNFVFYGLFEVLVLLAIYGITKLYGVHFSDLGLKKWDPSYIVLAVGGFFAYFVLSMIVRILTESFVDVPEETQNIGFSNPAGFELLLVFFALVILVPLAEEILFRGFLFKGIRSAFSFPVTAFVVSVMFAVAHGQLDVGLDVFALSLVLCYLRERTGSLWPGILLHSAKNTVAFLLLFVYNVG